MSKGGRSKYAKKVLLRERLARAASGQSQPADDSYSFHAAASLRFSRSSYRTGNRLPQLITPAYIGIGAKEDHIMGATFPASQDPKAKSQPCFYVVERRVERRDGVETQVLSITQHVGGMRDREFSGSTQQRTVPNRAEADIIKALAEWDLTKYCTASTGTLPDVERWAQLVTKASQYFPPVSTYGWRL